MSTSSSSTESPTFEYRIPFNRRFHVPIRPLLNHVTYQSYEQQPSNQIHSKDTTLQWVDDPITGGEKFRIRINIEGFNSNEVIILLGLLLVSISYITLLGSDSC